MTTSFKRGVRRRQAVLAAAVGGVVLTGVSAYGQTTTLNPGETFNVTGATTTTQGVLLERYYDNIFGPGRLNPIDTNDADPGLLAISPTEPLRNGNGLINDAVDFSVIDYDARYGKTGGSTFATSYTARFNVATAGSYSFGVRSDDGGVLYLDLNDDGDFQDTGELIVDNNGDHGVRNRVSNLNLAAGSYNMAIGYYQGTCCNDVNNRLTVRYGAGAVGGAPGNTTDATDAVFNGLTLLDPDAPVAGTSFSVTTVQSANEPRNIIVNGNAPPNSFINVQVPSVTYATLTLNSGAGLDVNGLASAMMTFTNGTTVAGNSTLNVNIASLTTGALSGAGTLTKGGTGSLNLNAAAGNFSGSINVTAGRLAIGNGDALGTGTARASSGGQISLTYGNNGSAIPPEVLVPGNALTIAGTGTNNNGALESSGGNNTTRTFLGTVTLSGDAFIVSSSGGHTLNLANTVNTAGFQARFGGAGNISLGSDFGTAAGIVGTGSLRKTEGGTLTILPTATATYTGETRVEGGTFTFGVPLSGTSAVNVTGGTVNADAAIRAGAPVSVTNGTYNANQPGSLGASATVTGGTIRIGNIGNIGSIPLAANSGGTIRVDPGAGGTVTYTGPTVNLGGGTFQAASGVSDFSATNLVGSPTVALFSNSFAGNLYAGVTNAEVNTDIALTLARTPSNTANLTQSSTPNRLRFASDAEIGNFFGNAEVASNAQQWTATFQGTVTARTTGAHFFGVEVNDDVTSIYVDVNQNGTFEQTEEVTEQGCCNLNNGATVDLTGGQTYNFLIGNRDTGGGGSMSLTFAEPGGGRQIVAPGLEAGGGFVNVDAGAELRARTITNMVTTQVAGGGTAAPARLTLGAGTVAVPLTSNTRNLNVSGSATFDVGANHTFTAQNLSVGAGSVVTKTGAGTLRVDGASTVTLTNGGRIVANAGVMDLSNVTLNGVAAGFQPGLFETRLAGAFNEAPFTPSATVAPGTRNAQTTNTTTFPDNTTFAYTGQVYVSDASDGVVGNGQGQIAFAENFDDNVLVVIDGVQRLRNTGWNDPSATGALTLSVGYHDFEARFGQGGGGVGPNTVAEGGWTNDLGFGVDTTSPVEDNAATPNRANYVAPDASIVQEGNPLFRVQGGGNAVVVDAGATLIVGGTTGATNVELAGTMRYATRATATNNTLGSLTVASGGTGTLDVQANQSVSVATGGTMALNGNLVKTGPGRLAVDVAGTGPGSVQVQAGTLGGSGSIAGPVSVASGATISPGNSPGVLGTGNLTLANGSNYFAEIAGAAPGTGHDQINVTGTVGIAGSNLDVAVLPGFTPTLGQQFVIINNDGADPVTGTFIDGSTVTAPGGFQFSINYGGGTGNDVVLTTTAIPEPAGLALVGLGAVGLLARRRRKA